MDGNGFRDTIIWLHAVELSRNSETVRLVSSDRAFFSGKGDNRRLKQDLANESPNVEWFFELGDLLRSTDRDPDDTELAEAEADLLGLLGSNGEDVGASIRRSLSDARVFLDNTYDSAVTVVDLLGAMKLARVTISRYPFETGYDGYYVTLTLAEGTQLMIAVETFLGRVTLPTPVLPSRRLTISASYDGAALSGIESDPVEIAASEIVELRAFTEQTRSLSEGLTAQITELAAGIDFGDPLAGIRDEIADSLTQQLNFLDEIGDTDFGLDLSSFTSPLDLSLIHISEPRDRTRSRMPSSA